MAGPQACQLSVIIPVYNEEKRLGRTLARMAEYFSSQRYGWELIVVDDGSRDGSVAVAEQAGMGDRLRVIRHEINRGKGAAVRTGMAAAKGEYCLFSDADLSTPIEEIEKFWPRFEQGYDVVIGSRGLAGSQIELHQNRVRELMGRTFNLLVRLLVVPGIYDTQCGFKMFSRRAVEVIFPRCRLDGWAFDVELLALALGEGFRIAEVPVRWINSPDTRVRALSASLQMFFDLLRLRRRFKRQ
ncbi:MAG: glycosyltransferase family 2 protein [Candidatus Sumerlaeia bacterium]|nr:glycosyltransferase family 2 protein [Candidatus Sumerlaeia bacterium]